MLQYIVTTLARFVMTANQKLLIIIIINASG